MRQRGCNGLSYVLDYAKEKSNLFKTTLQNTSNNLQFSDKLDEEVVQDGVRVIIDKKAQLTLLGKF